MSEWYFFFVLELCLLAKNGLRIKAYFSSPSLHPFGYRLAEVQLDMNRFTQTSVTDADFVKDNIALLEFFFSDKGRQIIHHREAYGLYPLLCDIGGAMGLFVGASILTTFELIDAILHHACKKVCKKI